MIKNNVNYVYFTSTHRGKTGLVGYPCDIVSSPVSYFLANVAYPFSKGDPFVKLFNHEITRLKNLGLMDRLMKEMDRKEICTSDDSDSVNAINVHNTCSAFALLAFGILVAVIGGIVERCCVRETRINLKTLNVQALR